MGIINFLAVNLQQAFSSIETWVSAGIAFLVSSGAGGVIIGLIAKGLTRKVNGQTSVSKAQIESAAKKGAETAVKSLVGKSFNVNIKSEVDKTIKEDLAPIKANAEYAAQAAKNAEIASANVLLAQSRSRLLNETEQASLQAIANKILAHANGEVVSPTVIEFAQEKPKTEPLQPAATEENASLVSFDDVK